MIEQLELSDPVVADAARRYVGARRMTDGATGVARLLELVLEVDAAYHELVVAVDGACYLCDPGTCPLVLSTRPL